MTTKREERAAQLEAQLPHFSGSEEYHTIVYPWLRDWPLLLTDGAKYLADQAGVIGGSAYWLIDLIASYQREKKIAAQEFQVWKLVVTGTQGKVICDDGNNHILTTQEIPFVDFALDEITLYAIREDGAGIVVLLPSEY
jgi:hypothetical protein